MARSLRPLMVLNVYSDVVSASTKIRLGLCWPTFDSGIAKTTSVCYRPRLSPLKLSAIQFRSTRGSCHLLVHDGRPRDNSPQVPFSSIPSGHGGAVISLSSRVLYHSLSPTFAFKVTASTRTTSSPVLLSLYST